MQILDAAFADSARRSGALLACRPGCTQCCVGVFAINALDSDRLRRGMAHLKRKDPARFGRVLERARQTVARLSPEFPGDAITGMLGESEGEQERFEDFGNEEVCPALDPATGRCDVYAYRPLTCRVFGPPVRTEDGLGCCELCYQGASAEQVAACEMQVDPDDFEAELLKTLESSGSSGRTIAAWVLASQR